jgi:tripeptidyl-peptidase-1
MDFGRYGQHLSKEQVDALVAPHPSTTDLVFEWLAYHNLPNHPSQLENSFLTVPGITVAQAERLLDTKYAVYYHNASDSHIVRTTKYSIPSILLGHVDVVAPTTYFGTIKSMRATSFIQPSVPAPAEPEEATIEGTVPSSCSSTITPACLRALYNTVNYVPAATSKNTLGVAGYLQEYANKADLQTFFKKYRTDAVGGTFTTVKVNGGGDDQSDPGVEVIYVLF